MIWRDDRRRRDQPFGKYRDKSFGHVNAMRRVADDRITHVKQATLVRFGAGDEIGDDDAVFGRAKITGEYRIRLFDDA